MLGERDNHYTTETYVDPRVQHRLTCFIVVTEGMVVLVDGL